MNRAALWPRVADPADDAALGQLFANVGNLERAEHHLRRALAAWPRHRDAALLLALVLEARAPFLDHRVIEFAASLPPSYRLQGLTTKYLLKRALRGFLPDENLTRRKMGFGVPISHWLRGELKQFVGDMILSTRALGRGYFKGEVVRHLVDQHVAARRDYSPQLWTLLMLELWHREFID